MAKQDTPKKDTPPTPALGDIAQVMALRAAIGNGSLTDVAIFHDLDIVRRGEKIILPEKMTYDQAIQELNRRKAAEEKTVNVHNEIACFPLDGLVALADAMKETFGYIDLGAQDGFWGPNPPVLIQVPVANGRFISAAMGKLEPTLWEGGYLEASIGSEAKLIIRGTIKAKFEAEVQQICARTRQILAERSIYRGQVTLMDFAWMEEGRDFHPTNDAPKFWEVGEITEDNLIVNEETKFMLQTNLYLRLEKPDLCRRNSIPLKCGALFMGDYGTGKTLAAKLIAKKAQENGWTFIYLKSCQYTATALRVAELYAPAVIFAEDIDQVTDEDRDEELNQLLNTIDGVDTKDKPIISIFTTNHPEKINKAFLRAGRIDVVVPFKEPDAKTAFKFVELYAKDKTGMPLLAVDVDEVAVGEALTGQKPAFISGIVQKAKTRALYRGEDEAITTQDLLQAASASLAHAEMVSEKVLQTDKDKVVEGLGMMARAMRGDVSFVSNGNGRH